MRPLELTIEGLRSFRSPVTVDLRGRDQIAIVGDTGAGKSSIIEAITYALYGQGTFSGLNRELMNDTSTQLRVVLRFQVADAEWEVVRTLRRSGAGTVGAAAAQLRGFSADGGLREMLEQVRPVNERIEQLMGLNRDAFLRTTVLPQGRFAQLLVEDDPRVRSTILRQVWRTDELEAAGQVAAAARQEIATLRARIDQAAAGYPEDPRSHLAQLQEQAQQTRRAAAAAAATETEASRAHEACAAAAAQLARVRAVAARLGTFAAATLSAELAPLAAAAEEIAGLELALQERQDAVAEQLAGIPADGDGPSVAQVAEALTTLGSLPRLAEEATAAAVELQQRSAAAEESRTLAEQAGAEARRAAEAVAAHAALGPPLEQARQAAERRREHVERLHAAAQAAAAEADAAREELARHDRTRRDVAGKLQAAAAAAERRAQAAARAREHLAAAQRSESAALVAGALHPGDECPICQAVLAPQWEPPAGLDLSRATEQAEAAAVAATEARDGEVALATRTDAAVAAVAAAEERLRVVVEGATGTWNALAEVAVDHLGAPLPGIVADAPEPPTVTSEPTAGAGDTTASAPLTDGHVPSASLPPAATLLAPLEAQIEEAVQTAEAHGAALDSLRQAAAERERGAGSAAAAAASGEQLRGAADKAAAAALHRLRRAVAAVPEPYRPLLELPAQPHPVPALELDPVHHQIAAARRRNLVLGERARGRDHLGQVLRDLTTRRAALAQRRATAVDVPLGVIVQSLNEHRDVLAHGAIGLDLELEMPGALTATHHEVVAARIDRLDGITADLLQTAAEREQRATAQRTEAAARLQAIGRRLGVGDEAVESDLLVSRARSAAESARFTARTAAERADQFAAAVDHVVELRELLGAVQDRERALSDLEAALKEGAFLKWLTLRRSRDLLVHASRTLEQISGGRYAFVEPADEFERWRVLDRDSGQPRSPASLSGGEQFIASLALALGMVEMMARSGGRLESLFLDEGFGSLDRSNLDAAIEALQVVAAGGRMVVLISHVQAVAEQVANVAAVTRTHTGSRIEWLSEAQRHRLVETDAGASALGGLLE